MVEMWRSLHGLAPLATSPSFFQQEKQWKMVNPSRPSSYTGTKQHPISIKGILIRGSW